MTSRTAVIIQARLGSTRLPAKVFADLGKPMLARVIDRCRRAEADVVGVATTTNAVDDRIEFWCEENAVPLYRGSENDVLARYVGAAEAFGSDKIIRVTSDCPFVDPGLIDSVAKLVPSFDYAATFLPTRTFPRGMDVEAMTLTALRKAHEAQQPDEYREHVTPYLYNHPELFALAGIADLSNHAAHRWTVDERDDLKLAQVVYEHFGHDAFGYQQLLSAFRSHPEWTRINQHIEQKLTP